MTRDELIAYWVGNSDDDLRASESLFQGGHHPWALFLGHLVLEKLLKALYVKDVGAEVPRIHDLPLLASRAGLTLTDDQEALFEVVTRFNIEARYPDYKDQFRKKATGEFTAHHLDRIREARQWLLEQIGT